MLDQLPASDRHIAGTLSLPAMAGLLDEAERLTEQAFLTLGDRIEDGHRQALELVDLAARLLRGGAGDEVPRLQQHAGQLAGNFAELVAALQFQDITRQRMEHVRAALAELLGGGAAAAAALAGVCRLQFDQLQAACGDFLQALERIDARLEGMAAAVEALVDATCAALSMSAVAGDELFQRFDRKAAGLGDALRAARGGTSLRSAFLARVVPVLAGLEAMAEESAGLLQPDADSRVLGGLAARYTMMSERDIHRRFVEGEERPPRRDEPAADAGGHGLGSNVELF